MSRRNRSNLILSLTGALYITLLVFSISGFEAKNQGPVKGPQAGGLEIIYPLPGTMFPPDIAPPTFMWRDNTENADKWTVVIATGKNSYSFETENNQYRPERELWEKIKSETIEQNAQLAVTGYRSGRRVSFHSIGFSTSKDSVAAPIFYRDLPLPFSYTLRHLEEVRWRIGDISSQKPSTILLENLPVCANCHSFSADGSTFAMDVDAHSHKDAYGIAEVKQEMILKEMIHWSDFQNGEPTYALLSNLSPNGDYVISTLKDNEFFVTQPSIEYSQLFFPIKGILVTYDRAKKTYTALPGANDTAYCQSNPSWTPDSKYIYYTRADAIPSHISGFNDAFHRDSTKYKPLVNDFYSKKREYKYDLYRVPFNGGKGGKSEPVPGASHNGMSNFFPKISPDGKWLVFTKAENFMLLQPDSKLYIMPVEGGEPRLMKCNTKNLNSWHSWSPNSHWIVFSSKMRGPYTKLYLTHIDENGNDSPPVCLEYFNPNDRACNIPEFVNIKPGSFTKIIPEFLDDEYFQYLNAIKSAEKGDMAMANENFSRAIEVNPSNFIFYGSRGYVRMESGDIDGAMEDFNKALKLKPHDFKLYNLRAFGWIEKGNIENAIKDFTKSIELRKDHTEAYKGRGYIYLQHGKFDQAMDDFSSAIAVNAECTEAWFERGLTNYYINQFSMAIRDFDMALKLDPKFGQAMLYRALSKMESGKTDEGCQDLKQAAGLGVEGAEEIRQKYCK